MISGETAAATFFVLASFWDEEKKHNHEGPQGRSCNKRDPPALYRWSTTAESISHLEGLTVTKAVNFCPRDPLSANAFAARLGGSVRTSHVSCENVAESCERKTK